LKKFKRLSFAASFRWVFRFSPGEDEAEHEPFGEGTLGGFPSGDGHWVLLLLDWVFQIFPRDDGALAGEEQERLGKRPLEGNAIGGLLRLAWLGFLGHRP